MISRLKKTVLVTGATGLIGSHIVDVLMNIPNVNVIALSRDVNKLEQGFTKYITNPNFHYITQDISKPLRIQDEIIDVIFHAAGPMENKIIVHSPIDVILPNICGTKNCLDFLHRQAMDKKIQGRLILFSSVTIYGNHSLTDITLTEADTEVTEKLTSDKAPYSQSKRMSEVMALAYNRQYGTDVVIARLSTVYGDTRFRPDTAFFSFVKKALCGEDIILNSSEFSRRDNIYIDDAVNALLLVCQQGKKGQAYNISSNGDLGNFVAIDEIAQFIADIVNKECNLNRMIQVTYKEGKRGPYKPGVLLDNSKLKSLGWKVQVSLEQGILSTIRSFKAG